LVGCARPSRTNTKATTSGLNLYALVPRGKAAFSDRRRRPDEESRLCSYALFLRLVPGCNSRDSAQNWQGMNRNWGRITVYRDANSAAAGAIGCGCMGVSRFQPVKDQNQQQAIQRNPTPEPARRELSFMDDTHSPVLSTTRNIARVQSAINRAQQRPSRNYPAGLRPIPRVSDSVQALMRKIYRSLVTALACRRGRV
jgi:hypothetical protein